MFRNKVLIWQLTDRGFGSEITTMVLAKLYCLERGIDFALCSKYWNAAYRNGWADYFTPFCKDIRSWALSVSYLFRSGGGLSTVVRRGKKTALALSIGKRIILNYDIWENIWNPCFVEQRFQIADDDAVYDDCFSACHRLLTSMWRLNQQTTVSIDFIREKTGLKRGEYFTVHIRRGDKYHEAKPMAVHEYIAKVREVNRTELRKCFIMTDDYDAINEFRRDCPDLDIVSLCEPSQRGHVQRTFNESSLVDKKTATLKLLAEISIAAEGAFFVGTFSSSLGRLIAMLRGRDGTFGVDMPLAIIY